MARKRETVNPRSLLTPAGLHILLSLADEGRHGYGIKLDVEERTNGTMNLGPATLYEAIHRMERSGWIEVTGPPDSDSPGRGNHRKYYRLTVEGRKELNAELCRLDDIVRFARSKKLLSRSRTT